MIVVKSSSKSWCYCWDYEGIGDIVLSYIWRGSCRPTDKTHVQMWIWFTWLGMCHRGSVVLQVAPQPREPSDGFCGLKLAGWESCNSYYLSWSPGHILGAKKSTWLNGSHLMLFSWSQANVLKRGPPSPLSTPQSAFVHQLPGSCPTKGHSGLLVVRSSGYLLRVTVPPWLFWSLFGSIWPLPSSGSILS